jgi:hypothetical protein
VVAAVAVLAVLTLAALAALVVRDRARRDAERRAESLAAELASVRDEVVSAHELAARRDVLVHSLWSLDLLRVGREWAASGSAHDDATVAVDTAAELAMALRLTLERQREETGVPGDLVASDLSDVPVATALAALRIAEEVLAVVSRPSEGVVVRLAGAGDDVVVSISLDETVPDVPAVVRALAEGAGASLVVDGSTVTVRLPA